MKRKLLAVTLFLFSCEELTTDKGRENPLDPKSGIALQTKILSPDSNYIYEYNDPIEFKIADIEGSNGKLYNDLIQSVRWKVDNKIWRSTKLSIMDSIQNIGNFPIELNVTFKDSSIISETGLVKVKELSSNLSIITDVGSTSEYFQPKNFSFSLVDVDGIDQRSWNSVSWTSDKDGLLSNSKSFTTANLSSGQHTITLTVIAEDNTIKTKHITFYVNEIPIDDSYSVPTDTAYAYGENLSFSANLEYNSTELSVDSIKWVSNLDGFLSSEISFSTLDLRAGNHIITLYYQAEDQAQRDTTFNLTIRPIEFNIALSPLDSIYHYYDEVPLGIKITSTKGNVSPINIVWRHGESNEIISEENNTAFVNKFLKGTYSIYVSYELPDRTTHDTTFVYVSSSPGQIAASYDSYLESASLFIAPQFQDKLILLYYNDFNVDQTVKSIAIDSTFSIINRIDHPNSTGYESPENPYSSRLLSYRSGTYYFVKNTEGFGWSGTYGAIITGSNENGAIIFNHDLSNFYFDGTQLENMFPLHRVSDLTFDDSENTLLFSTYSGRTTSGFEPYSGLLKLNSTSTINWYRSFFDNRQPYGDRSRIAHTVDENQNIYALSTNELAKFNKEGQTLSRDTLQSKIYTPILIYSKGKLLIFNNNGEDPRFYGDNSKIMFTDTGSINIQVRNLAKKSTFNWTKKLGNTVYLVGETFVSTDIFSATINFQADLDSKDFIEFPNKTVILCHINGVTKFDRTGVELWSTPPLSDYMKLGAIFDMGTYYRAVGELISQPSRLFYLDISLDGKLLNSH